MKTTFETYPLVIPGQTYGEAKAVLIKGVQRRVNIGPVWDGLGPDAQRTDPDPWHTVDPAMVKWALYSHGGVRYLQGTYTWAEEA